MEMGDTIGDATIVTEDKSLVNHVFVQNHLKGKSAFLRRDTFLQVRIKGNKDTSGIYLKVLKIRVYLS